MASNQNDSTIEDLPPHLDQSRVQTLIFNYTNWKETKAEVIQPASETPLYTIDYKMRKPHLVFHAAKDEAVLGTAVFHFLSSRIDIDVRGQAIELKCKKLFKLNYTFESPALQNQTMSWTSKSGWSTFDYVCLDENQLPVAKITASAWKSKKEVAQIDFLGSIGDNEAAKEELLITGLTLTYYMIVYQRSAVA